MSYPNILTNVYNKINRSGDTMTGRLNATSGIRFNSQRAMEIVYNHDSNGDELAIEGTSTDDPYTGACLYLHSDQDIRNYRGTPETGAFCLSARTGGRDDIHDCSLQGYPNGEIYWKGIPLQQFGFPNYSASYATGLPTNPTSANAIFTAPVDGWFFISVQNSKQSYTFSVTVNQNITFSCPAWVSSYCSFFIPMKRSDYVYVKTDCDTTCNWIITQQKFYGCRGNI